MFKKLLFKSIKQFTSLNKNIINNRSFVCSFSTISTSFPSEALVARYNQHGNPENVIKIEKQKLPSKLERNQVLVKMLLAPINPADLNMIEGNYPIKPDLSTAIGGNEGLGQILGVGEGVTNLEVNSYVIPAQPGFGTWRTHVVCDSSSVMQVPSPKNDKLKPEYLATLSVNPSTAYRLLHDFVKLEKGDVIIQNGANSMVGQSVIQIAANKIGVKTINIVRKQGRNSTDYNELVTRLKQYGAYIVVDENYVRTTEFKKVISDLPNPKLALNAIGGETVTEMARVLDDGGVLVTYGGMSRKPLTIPTSLFIFRDIQLKGFWLSKWMKNHTMDEKSQMFQELIKMMENNQLRLWTERHSFSKFNTALERAKQPFKDRKVLLVLDT